MAGIPLNERAQSRGKDRIGMSDSYNLTELKPAILKVGFKLVHLPEALSTMFNVRNLALSGSREPTVVLTDHQTAGVGREESKKWHDTPNSSILFSALIPLNEDVIAELADLVALRVCLALNKTAADFRVKAPNDIVHAESGKKVSGILVQNMYDEGNQYIGTNVGVGVNVHYSDEQLAEYPTDYGATSVDISTGTFNSRQQLFIDILEGISTVGPEAVAMVNGDSQSVRDVQNALWRENSYLLGRSVTVDDGDKSTRGVVEDTEIGQGLVILGENDRKTQINIFDTNTKVRIVA